MSFGMVMLTWEQDRNRGQFLNLIKVMAMTENYEGRGGA